MLKQVYEIDINNCLKEIHVKEFDEQGNCTEKLADNIITIDISQGLYRAKWNGTKWLEDMPQVEIDALNNVIAEPTLEDRILAVEDVILNLL